MSKKSNLYNIIMVLSFFALWVSTQLPDSLEFTLGYFLILTIGVGHGANDLKIFFKSKSLGAKKTVFFISFYVLLVLVGFALFFLAPEVILIVFLLASGYHFGQEHFEKYILSNSWLSHLFYLSYGLSIVLSLLLAHNEDSILIINDLLNFNINYNFILYPLIGSLTVLSITSIKVLQSLFLKQLLREIFYLIIIFILFQTASLLWGFAIYFILWHSIPSIYSQILFLDGSVSRISIKKYVWDSLLYWIGALLFLSVLYYFLKDYTSLFLSTIVAFLGGITFPHVMVMHRLHEK